MAFSQRQSQLYPVASNKCAQKESIRQISPPPNLPAIWYIYIHTRMCFEIFVLLHGHDLLYVVPHELPMLVVVYFWNCNRICKDPTVAHIQFCKLAICNLITRSAINSIFIYIFVIKESYINV